MRTLSLLALFVVTLAGCAARSGPAARAPQGDAGHEPRADDSGRPTTTIARTGRVALDSFALGGRVAWQALSTAASAAAGLVTDGTDGARTRWDQGAEVTRDIARTEARRVREAARGQRGPAGKTLAR